MVLLLHQVTAPATLHIQLLLIKQMEINQPQLLNARLPVSPLVSLYSWLIKVVRTVALPIQTLSTVVLDTVVHIHGRMMKQALQTNASTYSTLQSVLMMLPP